MPIKLVQAAYYTKSPHTVVNDGDKHVKKVRHVSNVVLLLCRTKFDFSTAVARLGFKRRATAEPNSIHKLTIH